MIGNLYFVDFGLEHVALLVASIDDDRLIDIPLVLRKKIPISPQRQLSSTESTENFEVLLLLISEAERILKTNIYSIILTVKNSAINAFFIQCKMEFLKKQVVSRAIKEKLATNAIKSFYKKTDSNYNMLDFICNGFVVDESNDVRNPYKVACKSLMLNATILGIKNTFITQISGLLERFKLHITHYISSCVSVSSLIKNFIDKNGNFLFIDFGSGATEYCIYHNGCLIYLDSVNIGGIDATRDISCELGVYLNDADSVKKKINDEEIQKTESKTTRYVLSQVENIADARLIEIIKYIFNKISEDKKLKNIVFKKIYFFGGMANYKNTEKIIQDIFHTSTEILTPSHIIGSNALFEKIKKEFVNVENIQLFGAVNFYLDNLNNYKNSKRGFLFKIPSKISCFLKDLLY